MARTLIFIIELLLIIHAIYFLNFNGWELIMNEPGPIVTQLARFILFVLVVDVCRKIIRYFYEKRRGIPRLQKTNFHYGINNVARVIVFVGFIIAIFGLFGVEFRVLLTSLSIVAAAIAILTKEYLNDFLVGLYFSFSTDFEINDYVRIGEQKGKIIELQMLKLKIINDDDDIVMIPNNKVYSNDIVNYTKRDIRSLSIDFQIALQDVSSIEELEAELIASLSDFQEFLEEDSFNMRIVEMKKDYMDVKFQYALQKFDRDLQRQIRKKTVRQVFNHITHKITAQHNAGPGNPNPAMPNGDGVAERDATAQPPNM